MFFNAVSPQPKPIPVTPHAGVAGPSSQLPGKDGPLKFINI